MDGAIVHRGEAGVAERPGAGEEVVVLKKWILINGPGDVAGAGVDALGNERVDELVAGAVELRGVETQQAEPEAVGVASVDGGESDAGEREFAQAVEQAAAEADVRGDDGVELGELGGADGGLRLAHAVVGRERLGVAAVGDAIVVLVAPFGEGRAEARVVRADEAAVAAADVFELVEGIAGEITEESDGFAAVGRAPGLGAVFDDEQVMLAREGHDRVHVGRVAGEMDDHDRLGFRREAAADVGGVEIVGVRVDVGEDGHELLVEDADDGAHVGDGRGDDFGAGRKFERGDGDVESGGAGGAGEGPLQRVGAAELGEERGALRAVGVEQRRLVDHGGEAREFFGAPAVMHGAGGGDGFRPAVEGEGGILAHWDEEQEGSLVSRESRESARMQTIKAEGEVHARTDRRFRRIYSREFA